MHSGRDTRAGFQVNRDSGWEGRKSGGSARRGAESKDKRVGSLDRGSPVSSVRSDTDGGG
jgi:hypothetical protein